MFFLFLSSSKLTGKCFDDYTKEYLEVDDVYYVEHQYVEHITQEEVVPVVLLIRLSQQNIPNGARRPRPQGQYDEETLHQAGAHVLVLVRVEEGIIDEGIRKDTEDEYSDDCLQSDYAKQVLVVCNRFNDILKGLVSELVSLR